MKKLLSRFVCLLFFLMAMSFAYSEDSTVVFDVNLIGGEEVFLGVYSENDVSFVCFYDGGKAEVNYLYCSSDEYSSLKKLAYECNLLMKSITTKRDYDNKKIYSKIMDKISSFGGLFSEDYDYVAEVGFVKVNVYATTKILELARNANNTYDDEWEDFDRDSLEDIDWSSLIDDDDSYSGTTSNKTTNGKTKL
ncbi:MAG: hypothetical protein IKQ43_08805, partial [Treponema sp.]|nr:hypothetical protein [Treponema sp.]